MPSLNISDLSKEDKKLISKREMYENSSRKDSGWSSCSTIDEAPILTSQTSFEEDDEDETFKQNIPEQKTNGVGSVPVFVETLIPRVSAKEGRRVELRVLVQDAEGVEWWKDDVRIPNSPYFAQDTPRPHTFVLSIRDPFPQDSGTYVVRAINSQGAAESKTIMSVFEGEGDEEPKVPKILLAPSTLIALKGENVVVRVKTQNGIGASVIWTKRGQELQKEKAQTEILSFIISNVSFDHMGKYMVKIENSRGSDSHACFLSVEGPPEPPKEAPKVNRNLSSIVISWLSCPYDGGSILTGYTLEISLNGGPWKRLKIERSQWLCYEMPGKEGEIYTFRVSGENVHGQGDPSEVSKEISIPFPPVSTSQSELSDFNESPHFDSVKSDPYTNYYEKLEELGKGRFGTVFKMKSKIEPKEYAGKIIRCRKEADKEKVREEISIMSSLRDHPKLLHLLEAYENGREFCIITEKIDGGELFERVTAEDFTLTEFDCIQFMRQICEGVSFIHSQRIIHLDLKPENILCLRKTAYEIKLIDFGLAQRWDSKVPLRVLFGTPEFVSPEIINYDVISPASDMWAVGVITYVLLSGLSPFMGDSDADTFANVTTAEFDFDDDVFDEISVDAKDFISALLIKRQEERMTAEDCMNHKWLSSRQITAKNIILPTANHKRFIIRRKWQKTGNAIRALGRIATLYRNSLEKEKNKNEAK